MYTRTLCDNQASEDLGGDTLSNSPSARGGDKIFLQHGKE